MHVARVTAPAAGTSMSIGTAVPTPRQPDSPTGPWPAWLAGILARLAERRQLLALEERDLRDMGLTQAEALALARKPLWRR